MNLAPAVCYRAVLARDVRFDGRFFTCVKTTGIYCRPICPARPPRLENCKFVPTAAAAQALGFRPCLRCRPESSPDLDAWRGTSATVSRALKFIENGALDNSDVASLADRLQIGERHLRRLFRQHIGAAPVIVAQTRRVLLAKQLIHQTNLSMIQVALASGFGSVRRFNETFQQLYHRPPGELRRRKSATMRISPEISLLLPYHPPYDWPALLAFLQRRAITGVEHVTHDTYSRVIEIDSAIGTIDVGHAPQNSALRVNVRFPRLAALPTIITRIRRMFDLSADPCAIAAALSTDPFLAPLIESRPGLRVPGGWDGFEVSVRAILGQQITLKSATALAGRFSAACGTKIAENTETPNLNFAFPLPDVVNAASLAHLRIPRARAVAIAGVATAICANPHLLDPRPSLEDTVAHLRRLPGVGEWTAQYIALRALGESDAFLAADIGVQRALGARGRRPTAAESLSRAERWRPWRAYALLHLWTAESDKTKTPKSEQYHALTA